MMKLPSLTVVTNVEKISARLTGSSDNNQPEARPLARHTNGAKNANKKRDNIAIGNAIGKHRYQRDFGP
jgi:hypothetical protein